MNTIAFLSGIYMTTFAASGVFFLKFYFRTRDRFFMLFALACWLLAVERVVLLYLPNPFSSLPTPESESQSWVFLIRLLAFLVIAFAIVQKNRKESSLSGRPKKQ
jgi:hypothetical protein